MIYIGYVDVPPAIEDKIRKKHNLTGDEVREAMQWPAAARAAWEEHPVHGRRVIASGHTYSGRPILAWLQPVDVSDGTWRLRSARAGS